MKQLVLSLLLAGTAAPHAPQASPASMLPGGARAGATRGAHVDQILTELQRDVLADRPLADLRVAYDRRGLDVDERGMAHIEIEAPLGIECRPHVSVASIDGLVTGAYSNVAEAWIPAGRVQDLARVLPDDFVLRVLRKPMSDDVVGEGPAVTNSADWRDAGSDGSGVTIAVIDGGFLGWTAAQNNGDVPPAANVTTVSLVFDSSGNALPFEAGPDTHGTECVEMVYDYCPGATYLAYRIDSVTDIGAAVVHAFSAGVDIVSLSQSYYNQGWADNTGPACDAANFAGNNDILFLTSAGNRRTQHWQGPFDPDGTSNWHDWGGGTRALPITLPVNGGGGFYLSWDTSVAADLDLLLFSDPGLNTFVASNSTIGNGVFEDFVWANFGPTAQTFYLAIQNRGTTTPELEVFMHSFGIATCTATGTFPQALRVEGNSTTSPSNASEYRVLSVAAVDQADYGSAAGADVDMCYSSMGPTNEGRTSPDIAGPTNISCFSGVIFGGTSAATPNVAGIAGVLLSDNPNLGGVGLAYLLRRLGSLTGDWGAPGVDDAYGEGGVHLVDYHVDTLFVDELFGNALNDPSGPYASVQAAHDAVTPGGRLMILGDGVYPESLNLSKTLRVESVGPAPTIKP